MAQAESYSETDIIFDKIPSSISTLIPTASPNPTNDTTASPNPTNDTTLNQTTNHPEVTHNITRDFQQQYDRLLAQ